MEQKIFSDKDKILAILGIFKLNIKDFANKIGVKKQQIYDITGGNTLYISREVMQAIAYNCPEISLYWLITGDGQPTRTDGHHNAIANNHSTATVNHTDTNATIARLTAVIEQQTRQINALLQLLQSK